MEDPLVSIPLSEYTKLKSDLKRDSEALQKIIKDMPCMTTHISFVREADCSVDNVGYAYRHTVFVKKENMPKMFKAAQRKYEQDIKDLIDNHKDREKKLISIIHKYESRSFFSLLFDKIFGLK